MPDAAREIGSEQPERAASGTIRAAEPLPPEKRDSPSPALGSQKLNAICYHPSCLFCIPRQKLNITCGHLSKSSESLAATSPQCQRTTVPKEKDLDRIEHPLRNAYTSFTGRDHWQESQVD